MDLPPILDDSLLCSLAFIFPRGVLAELVMVVVVSPILKQGLYIPTSKRVQAYSRGAGHRCSVASQFNSNYRLERVITGIGNRLTSCCRGRSGDA